MKKTSEPIVFFGSGPVAAKSLELLARDFVIEAVVTKPRSAHHKGDVPVLDVAANLSLPILTVQDKKSLDRLIESKPFTAKLAILIDFGIIVSRSAIDYFPLGIINSHFSILPEWRGADPITFAILSGQKQTGVSLMLLTAGLDEGPLLAYDTYDMPEDITTPELTGRLIQLSLELLRQEIPDYVAAAGKHKLIPQQSTGRRISYSRKLTKEDGKLDWTKPAQQLEREIRAFAGWPKSRATLSNKEIIVTKAHTAPDNSPDNKPGKIESSLVKDGILMIETGDGRLCVDRLKPAGKREMSAREFLAGNKV